MSVDVSIAQIVTSITTVFYAAVFAIGYYMMIKGNREVLREMREERLSGGSPQVIVETSLLNLPIVELVVRHVSGGVAKDITFEISSPIEDSSGYAISDLRYLREGIPLLGSGERIRCLWDHVDRLMPYLREKGLNEGIGGEGELQRPYGRSLHDRVEDQPPAVRRVALRRNPAFPRVTDCYTGE